MIYAYLGHHRCGSTSLRSQFGQLFEGMGKPLRLVPSDDLERSAAANWPAACGVVLRRASASLVERLPNPFRAFHLRRDPRDVWVSAYFAHLKSHPHNIAGLVAHRELLLSLPERAGLLAELDYPITRDTLRSLYDWPTRDARILEIRFEDWIESPLEGWHRILEFLGLPVIARPTALALVFRINVALRRRLSALQTGLPLPGIPQASLVRVVERHAFERLSGGRPRGQTDAAHHYRSGQPGDWRRHLGPVELEELSARFPGIVERLGYPP